MAVPVVNAIINFSTGPSFAQAFIIGSGVFGTNVLADSAAVIVDVSNQVNRIETKRGRNALIDEFQTGTTTARSIGTSLRLHWITICLTTLSTMTEHLTTSPKTFLC